MATYQEVQDRINNEYLNRGTFITETKTAIKAAIRHYENRRWTFNETAVALATSAGQSYVTFPSNFLRLDQLQLTNNAIEYDMTRRDRAWILSRNATRQQSQPTDYATYQGRLNVSPIPDGIYAIQCHYIKELPELSAATDTNAWIQGGMQDVICYHAAKIVWGVAIRNDTEASKFGTLEVLALSAVTEALEEYGSTQIVTPAGSF